MKKYYIVPEFRYYKIFPFISVLLLILAVSFVVLGHLVTSAGFILAFFCGFCALYYVSLSIYKKNYRLEIDSNVMIVWNAFRKPQKYQTDNLRWKIQRIPWYRTYYMLIYSSGRIPVAIIKPHWENALRITHFPHIGKLSFTEKEYLSLLKSAGWR